MGIPAGAQVEGKPQKGKGASTLPKLPALNGDTKLNLAAFSSAADCTDSDGKDSKSSGLRRHHFATASTLRDETGASDEDRDEEWDWDDR